MRFPVFSSRLSALPSVCLQPSWYLGWGNLQKLPSGASWQEKQLAIFQTQPVWSENRQFLVVGDIWLSNRVSLQHQLGIGTAGDLQLVAWLWERLGVESLSLLEGMFALAVWDRESTQLWLIRDRTGARTLYYTTDASVRWIAPRSNILSRFRSNELDLVALRDYLSCAFVPGERTLWQQVRELRPGTVLRLPEERIQVYHQFQPDVQNEDKSLAWHGERLRSLLERIILDYLPPGEPVGAFLSGGLDSSSVTALAAKFHKAPVYTYSLHFGIDYPHELEFSSLVAEHCGTQHQILEITPAELWENLPVTMAHLDDPIGDPLTVPNFLLGRLASSQVNIILNGEGGDPCFGGPKNQPMLLDRLYSSASKTPGDLVQSYLNSFHKCAADLPQLLKPNIWQSLPSESSVFAADLLSDGSYLNRLMQLNIKFKGADHILTKVNNMTRAAGLEGRSPLFDERIVNFSLQIPPECKLAGAVEKAVLKQAVAALLPEKIIQRPKSGMMVPVSWGFYKYWWRRARGLLLSRKAAIAPYLNQELIREWLNYRGDIWRRYGVKLWLLVSLEIWLQVNQSSS